MHLQFKKSHLSISQFDPVDLPSFTVLTGVNGSGKSHLLEAIERGDVAITGVDAARIVRFNYESFKLENESAFNAQQIYTERENAWQFFNQHVKKPVEQLKSGIGSDYAVLTGSCKEAKTSLLEIASDKIQTYKQNLRKHLTGAHFRGNAQAQGILSLARKLPYSIDEIPHEEFVRLYKPFDYKNDFLPQHLGKIIWDYYIKYRSNQVNEYQNEKHGKQYKFVTETEFLATHGPKPWELMNDILKKFDALEYRVNSPEGTDFFSNFHLRLAHVRNPQLQIDFSNLSSGEKILMALVACVYKASMDNVFPDVLLLDEVDASLHPSMMRNMIEVVHSVFLVRSIQVVMVTHSPTTIALAPEDSVYVMNRSGTKRIQKKSKQEALSILTEGFATLDEGLKLFDELAKNRTSIITEGNNTQFIKKALELYECRDVEVISGFEGNSGKSQIKTLFDFFSRAIHKNKVIFVWDCDASYPEVDSNNTYARVLPKNQDNSIAVSGIENMFPEALFDDFRKTITRSNKPTIIQFDETRKKDFEKFVLDRNTKLDFARFESFVEFVRSVNAK